MGAWRDAIDRAYGREVRLTLSNDPGEANWDEAHPVGTLVSVTDDGKAQLLVDGVVRYCWPVLDFEIVS